MRKKRHNYTPEEKVAIQASPRRTGSSEHISETIQYRTVPESGQTGELNDHNDRQAIEKP